MLVVLLLHVATSAPRVSDTDMFQTCAESAQFGASFSPFEKQGWWSQSPWGSALTASAAPADTAFTFWRWMSSSKLFHFLQEIVHCSSHQNRIPLLKWDQIFNSKGLPPWFLGGYWKMTLGFLEACQNPQRMSLLEFSSHLVLGATGDSKFKKEHLS